MANPSMLSESRYAPCRVVVVEKHLVVAQAPLLAQESVCTYAAGLDRVVLTPKSKEAGGLGMQPEGVILLSTIQTRGRGRKTGTLDLEYQDRLK